VCLFSTHDLLPDGRLASGGEDGKIKLWPDEGAGEPVILFHRSPSEVALLAGLSAVGSLAVLADGRLASGSKAGMIKLWPKEGAGEPVVFPNGGGAVFFLAALPIDGVRNAAEELRIMGGREIPMGLTPASVDRRAFRFAVVVTFPEGAAAAGRRRSTRLPWSSRFWDSVKEGSPAELESYLERSPEGG
jgi:hypothetical protein